MPLSRQHYERIAKLIREADYASTEAKRDTVKKWCEFLKRDNSHFREGQFIAATGLTTEDLEESEL